MNTDRKNPTPIVVAAAVAIAVAAGLGLFLFPGNEPSPQPVVGAPPVTTAEGQFTYAASLFDDGQARHFEFRDAGSNTTIKYFILKSTDGVIRAAFDACDVCWPEGKGYVQDGTAMVCRNCGRRFESVMVNEVQGGCNPAPLNRTLQGDQVVIRTDDLNKGRAYFNFTKKA
ncbi:MAG: DUF2318 domain-containing protein [Deltaproteobacteria bacterium]|nr:DUF2318 domain-containing protein [Deltaproteobacteria bacterium]